jgi:hypothetical protein
MSGSSPTKSKNRIRLPNGQFVATRAPGQYSPDRYR